MTIEVDLTYNKVDVTHKSRGCYKWVEITMQGFGDSTIYGVLLTFCFYSVALGQPLKMPDHLFKGCSGPTMDMK